jgi:hypothetical protein
MRALMREFLLLGAFLNRARSTWRTRWSRAE